MQHTSIVPSGSLTLTLTRSDGVSSARSCSRSNPSPFPCASSSASAFPRGGRLETEAVNTAALCRHKWCDKVGNVHAESLLVSVDTCETPARSVKGADRGFATQSALKTKGTCKRNRACAACCSSTTTTASPSFHAPGIEVSRCSLGQGCAVYKNGKCEFNCSILRDLDLLSLRMSSSYCDTWRP